MIKFFTVHPLTWCVVAIAIMTGYFRSLVLLFSLIFIHELGHYFMARFFRWRVRRIMILPFGGVAEVDEHGNRPFHEELFVTLAGPFQHLWLIAFGFAMATLGWWSTAFYDDFFAYNIMILVFNLLPIWPLDGGKLLFLLVAYVRPFKTAHLFLVTLSFSFLFLFVALCFFIYPLHLNLLIIFLFLLFAHYREWRQHPYVFMRFLLERYGYPTVWRRRKRLQVAPEATIEQIFKRFYKGVHHHIVVCPPLQQMKADERDLLAAYFTQKKVGSTISDVLRSK